MTKMDSYRIELFTNSVKAQELRKWLKDVEGCVKYREHARFGGSIFLIVAPRHFRGTLFKTYGHEEWFAMEGGIVRNVDTWEVESI